MGMTANQSVLTRSRPLGLGGLAFVAAHVPLAFAVRVAPVASTLHALATLAVGLWWAVSSRRPERVAYAAAYVAGAEVLWRMTDAGIFYETAKYATVCFFLIALARSHRLRVSNPILLYFLLLLPSAVLTVLAAGLSEAKGEISFNLSGPFALMASALFFSGRRLLKEQYARIFLAMLAPTIAVGVIATYSTVAASSIYFGRSSNMVTSGDFGPNQVSAILGLGALLCVLLVLEGGVALRFRALLFAVGVWLGTQSAFTFSRTGIVLAGACILSSCFYWMRNRRKRVRAILSLALLFAVFAIGILPRLNAITGGALGERFRDVSSTGRYELFLSDLRIGWEHPILGVGPGQVRSHRGQGEPPAVAHTEYSRMLAEHGMLGLVALALLAGIALRNLRAARGPDAKAFVVVALCWSAVFMLVSAMRLDAPAFLFGLSAATLVRPEDLRRAREGFRSSAWKARMSPGLVHARPARTVAPSGF